MSLSRVGIVVLGGGLVCWACNGSTTPSSILAIVRSVVVSPDVFTIAPNETKQLSAQVTGDNNPDKTVTWSSSNTKVATVGVASGIVSGVAGGIATIIATSKVTPSVTGTSTVTVTNGVDLTPLFGTFNISANKTTDTGCNFNQTFTGQFQVGGNTDGTSATYKMIERLTRAYSGTVVTDGSFTGTGSGDLSSGFTYNGTIGGSIGSGGSTITGTETLNFTGGCPGKVVIYQFTGTK